MNRQDRADKLNRWAKELNSLIGEVERRGAPILSPFQVDLRQPQGVLHAFVDIRNRVPFGDDEVLCKELLQAKLHLALCDIADAMKEWAEKLQPTPKETT